MKPATQRTVGDILDEAVATAGPAPASPQFIPGVPAVYAAISAVTAQMAKHGIAKDRKSTGFASFAFRGIDDVYNSLASVLAANKLVMLPRLISHKQEERQTKKDAMLIYTIVRVEFDLVSAIDGSRHTICMPGEAMDSGDKSSNKAMSAAFKYAAMQAFCIPTEGDNDPDATVHDVAPRRPARERAETVPDDFDAAAAALTVQADLDAAPDKAALGSAWESNKGLFGRIRSADAGIARALKAKVEALRDAFDAPPAVATEDTDERW